MAANDLGYVNSAATSLNLNDGSTYKLQAIRGIWGVPAEALFARTPLIVPAAKFLYDIMDMRTITAQLLVSGASLSALQTNINALWDVLWIDQYRKDADTAPRLGTLTYTAFNSVQRAAKVSPLGWGEDQIDWILRKPTEASKAIVTISFVMPSTVCFYNPSATTVTGNFNGTTPVNIAYTSAGNVISYPVITIAGAVTDPSVTIGGQTFAFTGTIDAGKSVVLTCDPQNFSAIHSTDGNWFPFRTAASTIPYILPPSGNATIVSAAGSSSAVTIVFNENYATQG
jgi:hypothetical protein